jgi:Probable cobalt transporter subunit (CbtA)
MILFGAAMGALFAVAYTICLGRTGGLRPKPLSMLVAAGGFLGFYLVPFVKYPANPPSIGHPETIGQRSPLYLLMVFCSLMFLLAAVWLGQRLRDRLGSWNASLVAGAAFVVAIGVVMAVLPSFGELSFNRANNGRFATETPQPLTDPTGNIVFPGFPADTLFNFRLYSIAAQAILWTTLGLIFAPMADRLLASGSRTRSEREMVTR